MTLVTRNDMFACSVHTTPKHLLARFSTSINSMPARFDASEAASMLSALGASKGGKARAEALTPEQRNEIAQKAANARWKKKEKE